MTTTYGGQRHQKQQQQRFIEYCIGNGNPGFSFGNPVRMTMGTNMRMGLAAENRDVVGIKNSFLQISAPFCCHVVNLPSVKLCSGLIDIMNINIHVYERTVLSRPSYCLFHVVCM